MLYFHKELKEKLKSDYQIQKAVKEKQYFKVDDGLYSDKPNADYIEIIAKKFPNFVIYGDSAYYYHNLTDFIPSKVVLATTKNNKIRSKFVKQVRLTDELFNIGITKTQINGIIINIYDKERMLIELARGKNQMGYDMYKEIIANYRKIADNLDMEKLEKYLSYFPYEDKLFEIIQDEVF